MRLDLPGERAIGGVLGALDRTVQVVLTRSAVFHSIIVSLRLR